MLDEMAWLERLEADGFVRRQANGTLLTKRWHAALARASLALYKAGDTMTDVRAPVARAILDAYPDESEESVVIAIRAVLPVVIAEFLETVSPQNS